MVRPSLIFARDWTSCILGWRDLSVGSCRIIHVSTDLIFNLFLLSGYWFQLNEHCLQWPSRSCSIYKDKTPPPPPPLNKQIINPQIISNYFNKTIFWTADAKRFSYEVHLFFRSSSFADQSAMQRSKRKRTPGKSDGPKLTGSLLAKNWLWILRLSLKKEEIYQWSMIESSGKNQVSLFIPSTHWVWFDLFYNHYHLR